MKFSYFFAALILIHNVVFSQYRNEQYGSKEFNNFDYASAIKTFESIAVRSSDVNRKLGKSFEQFNEIEKSLECYKAVIDGPNKIAQDYLNFGRILLKAEKYDLAQEMYAEYINANPQDQNARQFLRLVTEIQRYQKNSDKCKVENQSWNSLEEDFAPFIFQNQILFASSRSKKFWEKRSWNGNKKAFLDIYTIQMNNERQEPVKWNKGKVNKKFHEGPIVISSDGKKMFVTRNNYKNVGSDGTTNLSLFMSSFDGESWSEMIEFPYNSADFSVGHAAINEDGNVLVFVSNMPGGKGGTDLYVSYFESGIWSLPRNLDKVNTSGDEVFPFFFKNEELYFSSNGHLGIGGLDVFFTKWNEGRLGKVKNVGSPINSPYDDFSYFLDTNKLDGYFASNRKTGLGDDDIYKFSWSEIVSYAKSVDGVTKDKSGNIQDSIKINLISAEGDTLYTTFSDINGAYSIPIDNPGDYTILFSDKNKFPASVPLTIDPGSDDDLFIDVALEKKSPFRSTISVIDASSKSPLDNVKLIIQDLRNNKKEITYTDNNGIAVKSIRNVKEGDVVRLRIQIERDGYATKTAAIEKKIPEDGNVDIELEISEIKQGVDVAKSINLQPIYFDLNKFDIRPDAAVELNKIVKILNENPEMQIELGSHTDCRGSALSNQILSEKRAFSSAEYLKKRITNPDRIGSKGYGEYKILNGCICEGKLGPVYSEQEHAINRRTEFIILNK